MSLSCASEDADKICSLCNHNLSKYCCPRCDALYCSLKCYKSQKHFKCSEEFYKECITKELEGGEVDEDSRKKMVEILSRVHEQDENFPESIEDILAELDEHDNEEDTETDTDDEQIAALKERLKGINLDEAEKVWNTLTADEKNEFAALIAQGNIEKIIEQWTPWWSYCKGKKLVEEVGDEEEDKKEGEALAKCPQIKEVPQLLELTSIKPSGTIKFNIINVIASYAFIMRYFNGDPEAVETAIHILEICENLSANANFDDPHISIESIIQKAVQSTFVESDEESFEVMKHDTLLILNGPSNENKSYYCKAALSHLHQIFTDAKNETKKTLQGSEKSSIKSSEFSKRFPDKSDNYLPNLDVVKVKRSIKKIEYYLSFVQSHGVVNPG